MDCALPGALPPHAVSAFWRIRSDRIVRSHDTLLAARSRARCPLGALCLRESEGGVGKRRSLGERAVSRGRAHPAITAASAGCAHRAVSDAREFSRVARAARARSLVPLSLKYARGRGAGVVQNYDRPSLHRCTATQRTAPRVVFARPSNAPLVLPRDDAPADAGRVRAQGARGCTVLPAVDQRVRAPSGCSFWAAEGGARAGETRNHGVVSRVPRPGSPPPSRAPPAPPRRPLARARTRPAASHATRARVRTGAL